MTDIITSEAVAAFFQVVMIDLVLAGDNAVVIGLASSNLPPEQRKRAIIIGIVAATVLRIAFAGMATQLLQIFGLLPAGGVVLLWVCWNVRRALRTDSHHQHDGYHVLVACAAGPPGTAAARVAGRTFGQA